MFDKDKIAELHKTTPEQIVKEICEVQPIHMPKDWHKDPLLNMMLTKFVNRLGGKDDSQKDDSSSGGSGPS